MTTTTENKIKYRDVNQNVADELKNIGYFPLAANTLASRNFDDLESIAPDLVDLKVAEDSTAAKAAKYIAQAVAEKKHICVIGDYDADGICATTLMKLALDALGANVSWLVSLPDYPERCLDPILIEKAKERDTDLIISVDGGTSAVAGITKAKELNIPVIVTDHHLVEQSGVVDAEFVVNPHLEGSGLPAKEICGTVVAYILIKEVFRCAASNLSADRYLDLAAIATLTDVMPLNNAINRSIAVSGIDLIRKGRCRPAIKALFGYNLDSCSFRNINFLIGPMLNSARRMKKTPKAMHTLLADDMRTARRFVSELKAINRDRKIVSSKMIVEARELIEDTNAPAYVLYKEDWDANLVGIIASYVASNFKAPCVALCTDKLGTRGSMRSVKGISIQEVMNEIANNNPNVIERCGGHDSAAGVKLAAGVDEFRELFVAGCKSKSVSETKDTDIYVDANPKIADLTDGSIEQLDDLPWGKDEMPVPTFYNTFKVVECNESRNGNGYILKLELDGEVLSGWNRSQIGETNKEVKLVYTASTDQRNYGLPFISPICTVS